MATPKVMVLRVPGTTGDRETRYALEAVGAKVSVVPLGGFVEKSNPLGGYQALVLPGGTSHGDSFAPGRMWAWELNRIIHPRLDVFLTAGGMVLGTGNGFQAMIHAGWLPESVPQDPCDRDITVLPNLSGTFESRWVKCKTPANSICPLFQPDEAWELPLSVAWGRLVERSPGRVAEWQKNGQVTLCYGDCEKPGANGANGGNGESAVNPTGSVASVAGLCDRTGRVTGMMFSPERYLRAENHPHWTRTRRSGEGEGMRVFRRLVEALS